MSAPGAAPARRPGRPWALLALAAALAWSALIRVPLILNGESHLDSDLAVDGLTLLDATRGHGRWHFPGTPHIGIGPLLACVPQALVWGADPITLASGGTVLYGLVVAATFVLAVRAFGSGPAAWALVPLAFCSTGPLWLSARITGGHLLTAAWHAGAFAWLHACLARGGAGRAFGLGLWCGLGLYLDRMFLFTLVGLVPAGVVAWWTSEPSARRRFVGIAAILAGGAIGYLPHEIGVRVDPYDAYHEQFEVLLVRPVLEEHARLLAVECLPRLIVGHRLSDLASEPSPELANGGVASGTRGARDVLPWAGALTALGMGLAMMGLAALVRGPRGGDGLPGASVRWGLLISSAATLAAFVVNKNIYNSDNYRYLVELIVPWAVGVGLALDRLARRGVNESALAGLLALLWAVLATADVGRWYDRFGWIDDAWRPQRRAGDPGAAWLRSQPGITSLWGGYWDVYRLAFLTGGQIHGVPFPPLPDRFPERTRALPGGRPRVAVLRPQTREGLLYRRQARKAGGRMLYWTPGAVFFSWP